MRKWFLLPIGLVVAAVVVSLARNVPDTVGEKMLTAIEAYTPHMRSALTILDYTPDESAVTLAIRETVERGEGNPMGIGVDSLDASNKQWIRTANAVFFWSSPPSSNSLRRSLETARQQLILDFARGAFDDAETDAAFKTALLQLNSNTDEELFLDWANADRGLLAALDNRTAAVCQALLLLASSNGGPILVFDCGQRHVYLLPTPETESLTWCEIQGYEPNGSMAWTGMLRVNGHPTADRVRTLAVALVRQAAATAEATPTTRSSPDPFTLHF